MGGTEVKILAGNKIVLDLLNEVNNKKIDQAKELEPIEGGTLPTPGTTPAGQDYKMQVSGGKAGRTFTHATLSGGSKALTSKEIGLFYWNGTTRIWSYRNGQELPLPLLNNTTSSNSQTEAITANVARLLKLRELASSADWEVSIPATWMYTRTTGLLTQVGTLQIKLKAGNSLLVTSFADFQVAASSVTVNGVSLIYVDFDSPTTAGNIIGTIGVALATSMPTLADTKSRIVLGYSILITGTNSDLYSEKLGLFYTTTTNKRPLQIIKENADLAISNVLKVKQELQSGSGFVNGVADISFVTTTGILSSPSLQTYTNGNGLTFFLTSTEGAASFRITNFQAIPTTATNGVYYVTYADVAVPKTDTKATLQTANVNNMPAISLGFQRMIIGIGVKNSAIYDFYSPLLGVYKENDNRKKPIQLAIEATQGGGLKPLSGKTILYFGDSIVENKQLPERVATITGATVLKQGYGGCRMAKHTQSGNGLLYDKMCMHSLSGYVKNGDFNVLTTAAYDLVVAVGDDNRTQAAELAATNFNNVNYAIIAFGTNDYGASDGALIGTNTDMTKETFKGSINKVINDFNTSYPNIQLIFTTALFRSRYQTVGDGYNSDDFINSQGLKMSHYNEAIKELCDLHHLPCFDLNKLSGINKVTSHYYLSDGLHQNDIGDALLASLISGYMCAKHKY